MSTELLIHEPFNADVVFTDPARAKEVIATVTKLATEQRGDANVTTARGRATIRTVAANVAKSKTFVEAERKAYTADLVKKKREVDKIGGDIWDGLEKVQSDIRRPLTEWEAAEDTRVRNHEAALAWIDQLCKFDRDPTCEEVEERMVSVGRAQRRDWQEFGDRAKGAIDVALQSLICALGAAEKRQKDAEDLAILRAEKEVREAKEAEDRRATERERFERERREREALLVAEAVAAAERKAAAQAAENERRRRADEEQVERARAATEAEDRRRQASVEHRAKVNNEVKAAFSVLIAQCGSRDALAVALVTAIANGEIPNVTISY